MALRHWLPGNGRVDNGLMAAGLTTVLAAQDAPVRNTLIAAHLNRLEDERAQTRTAVGSLRNPLQPAAGPVAIEHRSGARRRGSSLLRLSPVEAEDRPADLGAP